MRSTRVLSRLNAMRHFLRRWLQVAGCRLAGCRLLSYIPYLTCNLAPSLTSTCTLPTCNPSPDSRAAADEHFLARIAGLEVLHRERIRRANILADAAADAQLLVQREDDAAGLLTR